MNKNVKYTVKTYYKTDDEEYIERQSSDFFSNKFSHYTGDNHFFEERRKIQKNPDLYICGFCKKPIQIYGGIGKNMQTLHFRHRKGDNKGCIYEDDKRLTEDEVLRIKYNGAKESRKHHDYKKNLTEILLNLSETKLTEKDVLVEKVYRNKEVPREWRKPDILAYFSDKIIAFELQLSTTFLSVIAAREEFYQQQQIFIFWLLDDFSMDSQKQLFAQKDILVSNVYNVFVIDDETIIKSKNENKLYLKCYYTDFTIDDGKIVDDKMLYKLVTLSDITFRENDYKVFYKDCISIKNELEDKLRKDRESQRFVEYLDDIDSRWNDITLKNYLSKIDVYGLWPEIQSIFEDLSNSHSSLHIENGIVLSQVLSDYLKDKMHQIEREQYLHLFQSKKSEILLNTVTRMLKQKNRNVFDKLKLIPKELYPAMTENLSQIINDLEFNESSYEAIELANFILLINNNLLKYDLREKLKNIISKNQEKIHQEIINYYQKAINRCINEGDPSDLVAYYSHLDYDDRKVFENVLFEKLSFIFFVDQNERTGYFYINLVRYDKLWFDIRSTFFNEENDMRSFIDLYRDYEDSSQEFFCEVIYSIIKSGYIFTAAEKEYFKSSLISLTKSRPKDKKNELLKFSLLQCYDRIQSTDLPQFQKQLYYDQLHKNWKFISRVLSVLVNMVIGCDLANIAGLTNNIKTHHLNNAHLYIKAAESDSGEKNDYKDNLNKLNNELNSNRKYQRNDELNELFRIIFPKLMILNED